MDEGTQGLYIFGTMAISFSLIWHWLVKNYKNAVVGATISTIISFQVVAAIHIGYIDPFIIIAIITSGAITAIIAAVIGLPFKAQREKNGSGS